MGIIDRASDIMNKAIDEECWEKLIFLDGDEVVEPEELGVCAEG